jgi:hypothetical protein
MSLPRPRSQLLRFRSARELGVRLAGMLVAAIIVLLVCAAPVHAQVSDTLRKPSVVVEGAPTAVIDSAPRPPITPRRAFLYSLAVPGSAQTILDRPRTAAFFITVEALSITLARKSANDLREARRFARDSIVATYKVDPVTGIALRDTAGALIPESFLPNRYGGDRVAARKTHFEDWIATVIFNHLISGAEAFVSAHLWNVDSQIAMQRTSGRTSIVARIPW